MVENEPREKNEFSISLKTGSEREQRAKELLEELLSKYPLDKWIKTREIIIEEGSRPHSHPVLTINTKNASPEHLLAKFLHEQIHWIEDGKEEKMNSAIEELKKIFPDAPVGLPEGADNEKSTYRHLIVCRLEFLAVTELLGEEKAKEVVLSNSAYTWIRRAAVERGEDIDPIIQKYFPEAWHS